MRNVLGWTFAAIIPLLGCQTTKSKDDHSQKQGKELQEIVSSSSRNAKYRERDPYRNPVQTLEFFGIEPDMTVVEIWPGGGWYAEILGPYLKDKGQYVAAGFNENSEVEFFRKGSKRFRKLVASRSPEFGTEVKITSFEPPSELDIIEPGTADAVLTFRNVHNWMAHGGVDAAFSSFFKALKPGGILGVVEHRASSDVKQDPKAEGGYVRQDYVISLAEKAGFKLVASSEINSNPKDTKDYPKGVWTLPPTLRLKDTDKAKYLAIGESDRMTLKFVKPGS